MVQIPGGTFRMGSDDGRPNERPAHEVTVAPFEMDPTEVTVAAYLKCVDAGKCFAPATRDWCNGTGQPNHPVNCVRWTDAKAYCEWVGMRAADCWFILSVKLGSRPARMGTMLCPKELSIPCSPSVWMLAWLSPLRALQRGQDVFEESPRSWTCTRSCVGHRGRSR